MPNAIRSYIAEIVESVLHLLCAVTNHARGCGILNRSPLRRVYWWAVNARWNDPTDASHNACPVCRFDRSEYVTKAQRDADVAHWEREYEISEALRLATLAPQYVDTWTSGGEGGTMYRWDERDGLRRIS